MIIIPAIDILDGSCVRLIKGEYETAHKVASDPLETALKFVSDGAKYLHMVDLNGAKNAKSINGKLICEIASNLPIPVEVGGGIRDMDTADYYIQNGISRIILGSAALNNPELIKQLIAKYADKIAVGIDCKNGYVSAEGWLETSEVYYTDFAELMQKFGVSNIIFTDIDRDGTLGGANLEQLTRLSKTVSLKITASGGVKDISDIKSLLKLNLYGTIVGKSVYSGTLNLKEAVRLCSQNV